ncbi:DUF2935 domain-containing protein [Sporolactobacillus nakayamae]|uniref:DUF2935 domain-containing protein n=1 Tax=Sporolactobacillus nakayamae TaxID=269670 RepID=A0A1I2W4M4_9BACL|nr:DUF2935 domain-containing protein [Sporolactobacillus nakayamae]SFG95577.1 protein of unknown function [Sporolactobacillus nakayamae]
MGYMDNYERDAYGIVAFWLRSNLEHGQFFDREISHHELELARVNQSMVQNLAGIWQRAEQKQGDLTILVNESQQAISEFQNFLTLGMGKALRCQVIVSAPVALMDHMIREAEESNNVFNLMKSGGHVLVSDSVLHESSFWLRQMADHLAFVQHYLDPTNYELQDKVRGMTHKFERLFLQANALNTIVRKPRTEMLPVLNAFRQMVISETKDLEKFKLELDALIKQCAAITTAPPDLLEHLAREAHHLWRNLEEGMIS